MRASESFHAWPLNRVHDHAGRRGMRGCYLRTAHRDQRSAIQHHDRIPHRARQHEIYLRDGAARIDGDTTGLRREVGSRRIVAGFVPIVDA